MKQNKQTKRKVAKQLDLAILWSAKKKQPKKHSDWTVPGQVCEKSVQMLSIQWRCKVKSRKPWYRNKCHQTSAYFLHLSNGICMDPREAAASWLQNLNSFRRQPAKSPVRDQGTFAAYSLASWHPWVNSGLTKNYSESKRKALLFFGLFC